MEKPPAVVRGTLELSPEMAIKVGTDGWVSWLNSPEVRSFRFDGERGTFTARKETPKAGNGKSYWNAAKKIAGKVVKRYLGRSEVVTLDRLEGAAEELSELAATERERAAAIPRPATTPQAAAPNLAENPDFQRLQAQVAELHRKVAELGLQGEMGGEQRLGGDARLREEKSLRQRNAELEDRLADLAAKAGEVFEANKKLTQLVAEVTEERENLKQQLASTRTESAELAGKVGALDMANQELQQRLAAVTAERDAEKDSVAEAQLRIGSAPAAATESAQLRTGDTPAATESATESAPPPDLNAIRQRVLAELKLGRQAPGYKAAAKALAEFSKELSACKIELRALPGEASSQRPAHTSDAARR